MTVLSVISCRLHLVSYIVKIYEHKFIKLQAKFTQIEAKRQKKNKNSSMKPHSHPQNWNALIPLKIHQIQPIKQFIHPKQTQNLLFMLQTSPNQAQIQRIWFEIIWKRQHRKSVLVDVAYWKNKTMDSSARNKSWTTSLDPWLRASPKDYSN